MFLQELYQEIRDIATNTFGVSCWAGFIFTIVIVTFTTSLSYITHLLIQ